MRGVVGVMIRTAALVVLLVLVRRVVDVDVVAELVLVVGVLV